MNDDTDGEFAGRPPLPEVPSQCGPPTIPLSVLLEFAIQSTYHEITVLSELMLKKTDQEKKISLVQFADQTRMQYVKLVALVRWLRTSKKFEACSSINFLLDQQASLYEKTADTLAENARYQVKEFRMPEFSVIPAVDVFVSGAYPRVPRAIKEAFIPEEKIAPREQAQVLMRLNQVIAWRISRVSSTLSPRLKQIRIKNGMAIFAVPGEFEVRATVLGESLRTPWTLLNVKILVEDYELGYGLPLVHPQQLHISHEVLQLRMNRSDNPIGEIYNFLHNFCISLQLEVLFCQTTQLEAGRLRGNIKIEKYSDKERVLVIGYWVQRIADKRTTLGAPRLVPTYRVQIFMDRDDMSGPLKVRHFPHAPNLGSLDTRPGRLSIDRLLSETFIVRSREKLLRIRRRIESVDPMLHIELSGCAAPALSLAILKDGETIKEELLKVSVNSFTGKVICTISVLETTRPELLDIARALYVTSSKPETIRKLLHKLRIAIVIERYRRSVQTLPVRERIDAEMDSYFAELREFPQDRLVLQFYKEEAYHLIVTFEPDDLTTVKIKLHLMQIEGDKAQMIKLDENSPVFMKPFVDAMSSEQLQLVAQGRIPKPLMQQRLASAVSQIEDRLTMLFLCQELSKKDVKYELTGDDPYVPGGIALNILNVESAIPDINKEFFKNMTRCTLRIDNRSKAMFPFETAMKNIPLVNDTGFNRPAYRQCSWTQDVVPLTMAPQAHAPEKIADQILDRLSRYSHLYDLTYKFSKFYDMYYNKYCNIQAYTFHKLVLSYGEQRDQLLIVSYRVPSKSATAAAAAQALQQGQSAVPAQTTEYYAVNFGQAMPIKTYYTTKIVWHADTRWNPHAMMTGHLKEKLNHSLDLTEIVHYLIATSSPLRSLAVFSRIRFESRKVLAQLIGHDVHFPFRLKYQLTNINETQIRLQMDFVDLEFVLLDNNLVAIRDTSRRRPRCPGLHQLFYFLSDGKARSMDNAEHRRLIGVDMVGRSDEQNPPRFFLAGTNVVRNNSGSMEQTPPEVVSRDDTPTSTIALSGNPMDASVAPIVVDHDTLHKACAYTKLKGIEGFKLSSPLDSYIKSLLYIAHAKIALEAMTGPTQPAGTQPSQTSVGSITLIEAKDDIITFTATQLNGSGTNSTAIVNFTLYVDPQMFVAKIKIEYDEGTNVAQEEVDVLTNYFEKVVYCSHNEMALQAFVLLCRITAHNAISSISGVMKSQMEEYCQEVTPLVPCYMAFQLVFMQKESTQNMGRRFSSGVLVDHSNSTVLLLLKVRRNPNYTVEPFPVNRQLFRVVYQTNTNHVQISQHVSQQQDGTGAASSASRNEDLTPMVQQANMEASNTGTCAVGCVVRLIIEKFTGTSTGGPGSQRVGSVASQPPGSVGSQMSATHSSMPGSHQNTLTVPSMAHSGMNPGSVGNMGGPSSVGGLSSGGPGSIGPHGGPGSIGSMGHYMMNPPSAGGSHGGNVGGGGPGSHQGGAV